MAFRGANKPKLANVIVSQNRRTARNSVGTDDPVPVMRSHLPCNSASKRSSARDWSARWESLCGFKSRIASASRSAPNTVSELIGSRLAGLAEPCGQNRVDSGPHGALQTLANLASLGPVASKYAVESEDLSRGLLHSCVHSIKRTLGGGGDEAKNEGGHCGDEPDAKLHRGSRVCVELTFWQDGAQPHSEQRARERTCEHYKADNSSMHSSASDFPSLPNY